MWRTLMVLGLVAVMPAVIWATFGRPRPADAPETEGISRARHSVLVSRVLRPRPEARYSESAPPRPGSRIYLDAEGRPVVPPPESSAPVQPYAEGTATGQASDPEITAAPGGGRMVILDGRFHHYTTAHVEAGDRLSIDCNRPRRGDSGSSDSSSK